MRRGRVHSCSGAALVGATIVAAVALLGFTGPASAQSSTWGGTGSSTTTADYNLGTNWANPPAGAPPVSAGQAASFDATGSAIVSVTAGPITPDSWTFTATSQSYTIGGQAVNFNGAGPNLVNNANAGQSITISNNMTGAGLSQAGASTLTLSGTNSFTSVTVSAGALKAGSTTALNSAAAMTVGTLSNAATFDLGGNNLTIGSLSGNTDGVVTNTGAAAATLTTGTNVSTMFSGTIEDTATASGAPGTPSASSLSLNKVGTGTLTLSGANVYYGDTTISGGTLALKGTGSIANSSGVALATGATFDISQTSSGAFIKTLGNTTAGQTGTVALGSQVLTITNASTSFGGVIQDGGINNTAGGSLTVNGGMLTLNGVNTYTGLTSVGSDATLVVGDSTHATATIAGAVRVYGGTLAGYGVIQGSVILSNGATLTPGAASQIGSLTINGDLTIGNGTRLNFDFGVPGPNFSTPGQSDHVVVGGNLSIDTSTLNVTNIGGMGPGLYELFHWTNGLSITGGGFAPPSGMSLQVLTVDKVINLVDAQNLTLDVWNANGEASSGHMGGGSGTWSNAANVWTDTTGSTVGPMSPQPGFAIFGGAAGTVTVDDSFGAVGATGMQFLTDGYHLTGDALTLVGQNGMPVVRVSAGATAIIDNVLEGAAGLNKTDAGTLVLTGINTYTGGTVISGGTLSVGSNSNLGDPTGGLTLNGGILQVTGTSFTSTARAITLGSNGGGFDIADAANTFTVNQQLSGAGGLAKLGAGTLTLTGANSYTGATTVSAGMLVIGNGGSITNSSSLTNAANVLVAAGGSATFGSVTNTATGIITVAAGGTVHDDLNNAGTVTNNGAYFANVASNSGSITNNGTWTGTIATAGTFVNGTGATVSGLVTNSGTASNAGVLNGGLTNTGGTFNNTGTINGTTTISGGALLGTGSVGNLSVGSGAVFAPGNGTPGTAMTVNGSLAFSSGAFYQVALNPQTASFVTTSGAATLGGATVQAFFSSGSYVAKQYTIVNAAGGIGGTFNALANTNLPSGFTSSLSYDATHAYLDLALNFAPPANNGLTVNQRNVGNALINSFNTAGTIPIVFGALTPAGLTQASGESATASQQTTFDAMNLFMGVMTDPFVAGRGDPVGANGTPTPYAAESLAYGATGRSSDERNAYAAMYAKASVRPTFEQRWSVWAAGFGGSQTTSGDPVVGSNNTTSSVYGTAVGADYRFSPDTLVGFALAGGGTNFNVNGLGYGRSDLFQAGAFIRHSFGPAYITAALAYGWQDITTDRIVTAAGIDHLRAEFNANAWSGRVEGGYRFVVPAFGGLGITPYAAGQFTTFDLPGYAESVVSGSSSFALAYGAKDVTDVRSELGLRTDKSFALSNGILTLRSRFAWAHDYDPDRSIAATFQALPASSFVVNGAAQASDSALTTASIEMKWLNGWSTAATFEGEFSNVTSSYSGKGVVRYAW